jgi:hypothetical protein
MKIFSSIYDSKYFDYEENSLESYKIALSIFFKIYSNIEHGFQNGNELLYKPISDIGFNRNTILKTIFFLEDYNLNQIKIHNRSDNDKLQFQLLICKKLIYRSYIDVEKKNIPIDLSQNIEFGKKWKMKEKHELQRLKDEKLITWRNQNHHFKVNYFIKLLIKIQVNL